MLILSACIERTQDELTNARRLEVYQDMTMLRQAIVKYIETNKTPPSVITELSPIFVSEDIINRPERYDLRGKNLLVPAKPYGVNIISNGFEITCVFFGKDYTQVVMDVKGEVTVR